MSHIEPEVRKRLNSERCPICNSIEGCDHTIWERLRALQDHEYRDRMRADDPLPVALNPTGEPTDVK